MTVLVLCAPRQETGMLAADLALEGVQVRHVEPAELNEAALVDADALLIQPNRTTLTAELVAACDRRGVRIMPVGAADSRILTRFGLPSPLAFDTPAAAVLAAITDTVPDSDDPPAAARVITVWGPHGAPGRSTLAIQLAVELARAGRSAALVDADSVAPSIALQLGLSDEAPGLAAACRRADLGSLDAAELDRLSVAVETSAGTIEVLCGINRPSRWPELSGSRVRATLATCRSWVRETVVDVSAELGELDDVGDATGPQRHAATMAALCEADHVLAVLGADPLGVSRFVRGYAELRHVTGDTPVTVIANGLRHGPLGIDARGQIRHTLERFAGIAEVVFLPHDQRTLDAAALHARIPSEIGPRSPYAAGVRRIAAGLGARTEATGDNSKGSSRAFRLLR